MNRAMYRVIATSFSSLAKIADILLDAITSDSRIHVLQTLTIAKNDLTRAGKSEHTLVVQL